MKPGYACINTSVSCTSNSTFRLNSYSEERLVETIKNNLECLKKILDWNKKNNIVFFRIGSQIIPFASHPICKFNWKKRFRKELEETGRIVKRNKTRITMHPDQFVVLNSLDKNIVKKSIKELEYHCGFLDAMKLDSSAKIVLHVGGVYNNKKEAMERFITNYKKLKPCLKKRLVIENDHRSYSAKDCLEISKKINVPVIVDNLHHECLNNKELLKDVVEKARKTWKKKDGVQILHYSEQKKGGSSGSHSETINPQRFKRFIQTLKNKNVYVMIEVKDKEQSVLKVNLS